jgi:hypothetical protein
MELARLLTRVHFHSRTGGRTLKVNAKLPQILPRIVPRRSRIKAIMGTWEFGGERVRLLEEPETGVLVAMTGGGIPINPMQVISRGFKIDVVEIP